MPSTEHDELDPVFSWRLKAALDRVTPPASLPRYASVSMGRTRAWRVAPFLLAGATVVLLALTATATTGSPNPVVWTQHAATTIQSVGHAPETIPSPQPAPEQAPVNPARSAQAAPAPAATQRPQHDDSPTRDGSEQAGESSQPQPEPKESSDQRSGHSGSGTTSNSTSSGQSRSDSHNED
jgi:hypothetical protein